MGIKYPKISDLPHLTTLPWRKYATLRFSTICAKNHFLKLNIYKVTVSLRHIKPLDGLEAVLPCRTFTAGPRTQRRSHSACHSVPGVPCTLSQSNSTPPPTSPNPQLTTHNSTPPHHHQHLPTSSTRPYKSSTKSHHSTNEFLQQDGSQQDVFFPAAQNETIKPSGRCSLAGAPVLGWFVFGPRAVRNRVF